jgi:uncharacterized membrane protein SpoIIM required for sporulation
MHRPHVIRAWKWLLAHLVIAASVSYLATLMIGLLGLAELATLYQTTTAGVRHVGGPLLSQGMSFGIDPGVVIFLCNLSVAMLIVGIVYWVRMLNPHNQDKSLLGLRRRLQKDRSAEYLRKVPPFAQIHSPQLRLTAFLLLGAPYIATITLGLLAGALLGTAHLLSSSPLVAMAYLLPHGIPEVAALLLACSIPVGIWMHIRPVVDTQSSEVVFRRIDRVVASQYFQQSLKMIVTLLMIAGLIEAHLTLRVVAMISGS